MRLEDKHYRQDLRKQEASDLAPPVPGVTGREQQRHSILAQPTSDSRGGTSRAPLSPPGPLSHGTNTGVNFWDCLTKTRGPQVCPDTLTARSKRDPPWEGQRGRFPGPGQGPASFGEGGGGWHTRAQASTSSFATSRGAGGRESLTLNPSWMDAGLGRSRPSGVGGGYPEVGGGRDGNPEDSGVGLAWRQSGYPHEGAQGPVQPLPGWPMSWSCCTCTPDPCNSSGTSLPLRSLGPASSWWFSPSFLPGIQPSLKAGTRGLWAWPHLGTLHLPGPALINSISSSSNRSALTRLNMSKGQAHTYICSSFTHTHAQGLHACKHSKAAASVGPGPLSLVPPPAASSPLTPGISDPIPAYLPPKHSGLREIFGMGWGVRCGSWLRGEGSPGGQIGAGPAPDSL